MHRAALLLAALAVFVTVPVAFAETKSTETIEKCWKEGMSHAATVQCAAEERKKSEEDLESAYAVLRKLQDKTLADQLKKSEAAFTAFRDAQCTYEAGLYGNSKGAADQKELCLIKLTEQQTDRLREAQKPHQ